MTDTKQPEALFFAAKLEDYHHGVGRGDLTGAAAVLREQHGEVERLTECLRNANCQAEKFEREWYLRGDEIEAKDARISELEAQLEAIGAGGVTGLRDKHDGALWCVHVYGPDDIHAMPSRAAAFEEANGLNAIYAQTKWDEYTPIMTAVVEPWLHSPDTHAADVALLLQCQANRAAIAQEGGK